MAGAKDNNKDYIWGKRKNTKMIILIVTGVVVIAGALGYVIFGMDWQDDINNLVNTNRPPKENLVRRALDGVYVPADQSNYYPLAVMIENFVSSRPPSSLSRAGVVYEALAEGGITRFMAIYTCQSASLPEIGPVRSARPYYIDWLLEYNALYAHMGGSPQALTDISQNHVLDVNQGQYYWRDETRNLPTEHTLYTSGEKLAFALRDKKIEGQGDYRLWKFKDDAAVSDRPTEEKNITIEFSSFNYNVEYKYNSKNNNYLRYQAGEVHKDRDGAEIAAKDVVVQKVKTSLIDAQRLSMVTVGEGEAIIFRDGRAVVGTWKKESKTGRTVFYDGSNNEIAFNAGPIWIEVVPTDRNVQYN
ncbi:MAG: DUF3048 domain-containing protein [Patescibacteria group bacterium]|jgi:hypothetical protein